MKLLRCSGCKKLIIDDGGKKNIYCSELGECIRYDERIRYDKWENGQVESPKTVSFSFDDAIRKRILDRCSQFGIKEPLDNTMTKIINMVKDGMAEQYIESFNPMHIRNVIMDEE